MYFVLFLRALLIFIAHFATHGMLLHFHRITIYPAPMRLKDRANILIMMITMEYIIVIIIMIITMIMKMIIIISFS